MTQPDSNAAASRARAGADEFSEVFNRVKSQVSKLIVGQEDVIDGVLTALMCGGHVLLEGVPGLGKTMLVKSLGEALNLKFSRIQFTPDMMPADIQGTMVLMETEGGGHELTFQPGAGRRDQPCYAQDPVGAAGSHAGAPGNRGPPDDRA